MTTNPVFVTVSTDGRTATRAEHKGEAALAARRRHARAEPLPDLWRFAAEPWEGPLEPWQRLQLAVGQAGKKYIELAYAWRHPDGRPHSTAMAEKLVRGDRPLRREHVHAFAPLLGVSVPWLAAGIMASMVACGRHDGDDYFQFTPEWLHEPLERLLQALGSPHHELLRRQHTLAALRGQSGRSAYPPAVRGERIIVGEPEMFIESGLPPRLRRMGEEWWSAPA